MIEKDEWSDMKVYCRLSFSAATAHTKDIKLYFQEDLQYMHYSFLTIANVIFNMVSLLLFNYCNHIDVDPRSHLYIILT